MCRHVIRAASVLVCAQVGASAANVAPRWQDVVAARVKDELHAATFALQPLELPDQGGARLRTSVRLGEREVTLEMTHHSVRASDFRLLVQRESGAIDEVEPAPPETYRGIVLGAPGSVVAGSLHEGQLTALVKLDGTTWTIHPLRDLERTADARWHVIFSEHDVVPGDWRCAQNDALAPAPRILPSQMGGSVAGGTGNKVCDIAFDADYEFYHLKNQDSVENTLHDIENIMVGEDVVYERDVAITYEVTVILVRTADPDPYFSTDAGTMLGEFVNEWTSNQGAIRRDVAHLMTGKDLDGGIIGLAYLTVICNGSYGYGLSQSRFTKDYNYRVTLTAHELGHNWSAGHCDGNGDCHIMCSGIGGCDGIGLPNFGAPDIAQILSYKGTVGCLGDEQLPLDLPFFDDVPGTTLDPSKWTYNYNASVSSNGSNEPSPPWVIQLNASGAGANRDDDLRTNEIRLGSVAQAKLTFFSEHRNVEAGEQLVVEYWSSGLLWKELMRLTSDGINQDDFVFQSQFLPADAYHDGLRLRFRPEVDQIDDAWYLDDIALAAASCPDPSHYGLPSPGSGGVTPTISWSGGVPFTGNASFHLVGSSLYGGQQGLLFVGFTQVTVPLGDGAYLNVAPPWLVAKFTVAGLPFPGYGSADIPAPIPSDPALDQVHFYSQFMCTDPGGPMGITATDGLDATICH
ncbi:MAG: M12 family metallo-peptidase [Planctomycetota bacterium]